jgi:uncharacterized delta-60 repeat protein
MKKYLLKFIISAATLLVINVQAQDGINDPTFNPGDIGSGNGDGANGGVSCAAMQNDDKIIIGGGFWNYNSIYSPKLARVNADGTADTSFHVGSGPNNSIYTISVNQNNGKIYVGGNFFNFNGTNIAYFARLKSDGLIDPSFSVGFAANYPVRASAVQADGKVVLGGDFTFFNGQARNRVHRLDTTGANDATFSIGTGANSTVRVVLVQPDGKIIVCGDFSTFNGFSSPKLIRLNSNGSRDTTFNPGTGPDGDLYAATLQSDGKIIIGGWLTSYNGVPCNQFARINTDGSLDTTFSSGSGVNGYVNSFRQQADGKLLASGWFTMYNGTNCSHVIRMNTDGSFDSTFISSGTDNAVNFIGIQSGGQAIMGGTFWKFSGTGRYSLARANTDGSNDPTFNPGYACNGTINTMQLQPDGKIIAGGYFSKYFEESRLGVARINTDGSLDTTFNPGTGANNILTSALQQDGKIIIGGDFTTYNGISINRLARLNSDGSLDTTFNTGTGANFTVYTTAVQSDGKIIVGGYFSNFNGSNKGYIVRLHTNGSVDSTFNISGTGADFYVNTCALQPDGKIVIGGYITTYNGTTVNHIARLNTNGTLDATFNTGTGADQVLYAMAVQPDGKIVIGGAFTTINGSARNFIARLESTGSVDTTFTVGTGFNTYTKTITLQTDGKIIVGGGFASYNGTNSNYLIRLNSGGTADPNFTMGTGPDLDVDAALVQVDGQILIGGDFTSYNGVGRNRIARLNGTSTVSIHETNSPESMNIYPNPFSETIFAGAENSISKIRLVDLSGKTILEQECNTKSVSVATEKISKGIYLLEIFTSTGKAVRKIVKE